MHKEQRKQSWEEFTIFGDKNCASDFVLEEELLAVPSTDILTILDLDFSKDQDNKIYVQDRIWEPREDLRSWMSNEASVHIYGNGSKIVLNAENTFRRIARKLGNYSENQTNQFLSNWKTIDARKEMFIKD
jgi:sulfite reductase (NADPH) flavoprotein alpha-component